MPISPDPRVVSDTTPPPQTFVVPPDGGQILHAYGDTAQIKLSGAQTNGLMVVALSSIPPGGGPPPHRHQNLWD